METPDSGEPLNKEVSRRGFLRTAAAVGAGTVAAAALKAIPDLQLDLHVPESEEERQLLDNLKQYNNQIENPMEDTNWYKLASDRIEAALKLVKEYPEGARSFLRSQKNKHALEVLTAKLPDKSLPNQLQKMHLIESLEEEMEGKYTPISHSPIPDKAYGMESNDGKSFRLITNQNLKAMKKPGDPIKILRGIRVQATLLADPNSIR